MKATPRDIDHALRQARQIIQTLGLLLDANENATERVEERVVRVTWATASVRPDLSSFVDSNIEEYLTFVRGRHYSMMLSDGALIQMSYDVHKADEVIGSRLVWYPCPADVTVADLEFASLEEIVLTTPTEKLGCRAPVRLDFAPHLEAENHAATHLHFGFERTRLPVQRAMEPMRFLGFVLKTAYPDCWKALASTYQYGDWSPQDNLTADDRERGALAWHPKPASG